MRRGLKPHNCLLGIAVPLSREQFFHDLKPETEKDFVKSRARRMQLNAEALWTIDYEPMVRFVNITTRELMNLGVTVITNFTLNDLTKIGNMDVFTLIAHWNENKSTIELNDKMVTTETLVGQVPVDFKGIFDLTVCHSINLQTAIKKRFSNLVIANEHAASVEYRLINYKYCMLYVRDKECTYIDALTEIRKNIYLSTYSNKP